MSGEKTEAPTPQRLREARRKGQVARSRLLAGAAVTLACGATTLAGLEGAGARLRHFTTTLLSGGDVAPARALEAALGVLVRCAAPPLGAALLASLAVSVAFAGLHLQPDLVAPRLERVSPAAGLARLFSVASLLEGLKGAALVGLLGWLSWRAAVGALPSALARVRLGGAEALGGELARVADGALGLAALLAVLGLGDWALARRRHLRGLRMSREEVKQEHKQSEGDPQHKAHRKALHRQLAAGGPARGVHKATAVVVNPTHIAVALRYAPEESPAPYLVARGRDAEALALKAEARRLGIPVVRDVPLARSLVHYDVGEQVPEELYQAAAAVLVAARQAGAPDGRTGREDA
jgi:type III secretion protein U